MSRSPLNRPLLVSLSLLLCLTAWNVETGFGQDREAQSKRRFLQWSYQDAGAWITSWDRKRLLQTGGTLAVLAPLSLLDEEVSETAMVWDTEYLDVFLDNANEAGSLRATLFPAGLFVFSLVTDNDKFQDAAFTSLQSVVYANLIGFSIKSLVGRGRPEDGHGAHHFDPFSELDASFPSGHTATAFAILSPWAFYYPNVVTYGVLIVGGGAAVARVQRQRHWMTDVLGGGALGLSTAYWLSRKHQGRMTNLTVVPVVRPGTMGLTMQVTF
ncbi:phosphatase PAP2 family protein [bacterium]|nr:phosphatase PAP2 family protein [bacterium]